MSHPFLSPEWMTEVHAIRERYADQLPVIAVPVRVNQVVNGAPFGDEPVEFHLDTTSGHMVMEFGHVDDADATVTTDYDTAKLLIVEQDPAAGMQAFMAGKVVVQGDMMKLMAMQTAMPPSETAAQMAAEVKAATA